MTDTCSVLKSTETVASAAAAAASAAGALAAGMNEPRRLQGYVPRTGTRHEGIGGVNDGLGAWRCMRGAAACMLAVKYNPSPIVGRIRGRTHACDELSVRGACCVDMWCRTRGGTRPARDRSCMTLRCFAAPTVDIHDCISSRWPSRPLHLCRNFLPIDWHRICGIRIAAYTTFALRNVHMQRL